MLSKGAACVYLSELGVRDNIHRTNFILLIGTLRARRPPAPIEIASTDILPVDDEPMGGEGKPHINRSEVRLDTSNP